MTLYLGIAVFILSVFALIYVYLISPRRSSPADMELLSCDYAHRGLWTSRIPENSMSAFEYAARRGVGIELDVQPTRDGRIVVFHDDDLFRMCGVKKRVRDLTLRELRTLRLKDTGEVIPTLAEVLRLVNGRVPLLIEIKGDLPDERFCRRIVELLDSYKGPFCIEAFSPMVLRWFRKYRPSFARGQLVGGLLPEGRKWRYALSFLLSNMLLNFISRPDFVAVSGKKKRNLSLLVCARIFNVPVFIWTVRAPRERAAFRRIGYFTIFENFLPKEYNKK